jgi:hypothetical protein
MTHSLAALGLTFLIACFGFFTGRGFELKWMGLSWKVEARHPRHRRR